MSGVRSAEDDLRWLGNELEREEEREAIVSVENKAEASLPPNDPTPPPEAYANEPMLVHARHNGGEKAKDERPQPEPMDWRALKGLEPPPRLWWIQDWFGPNPTLCSGGGGIGKSLLWQTLGTALAFGKEFIGPTAAPLRVFMLACEDDRDEIWRRQTAICEHFNLAIEELEGKFTVVPRYGHDNTLLDLVYGKPTFTPQYFRLREQVNDLRADVLVADNNAQTFGGNENDRHQVTMFVNGIHGIGYGRPFAAVLLGHTARAAGSEYSGSAAWENACRMRWYMGATLPDQKPEDDEPPADGVIYLAKRKVNYAAKDWRKLKFVRGLWLPEEYAGRRFDAAARDDVAEAVVLKGFARLRAMGVAPTDGKTSGDYLPNQIAQKKLTEGFTKKELAEAMHRLMTAGKFKRGVVGKDKSRHDRLGLLRVEDSQ